MYLGTNVVLVVFVFVVQKTLSFRRADGPKGLENMSIIEETYRLASQENYMTNNSFPIIAQWVSSLSLFLISYEKSRLEGLSFLG